MIKTFDFDDILEIAGEIAERTGMDVGQVLLMLQEAVERRSLEVSAELYAEVYEEEHELKALTEAALAEWPEDGGGLIADTAD